MADYGKIYHFGHRHVRDILFHPVVVEEKIDGSQFSCGVTDDRLWCASKSRLLPLDTTDKLFYGAVQTAKRLYEEGQLYEGFVMRGEAMCSPRHNKLRYERTPKGNVVVFDLQDREGHFSSVGMSAWAEAVGLESVQVLAVGLLSRERLDELVHGPSMLGGCDREGIVIKSVNRQLKCKIVSDAFREKKREAGPKHDSVSGIVDQYRTHARWDKAIQHLREAGELKGEPRDIPAILREISRDLAEECEEEIRNRLWPRIWKDVRKGVGMGAADYYLAKLGEED